MKLSAFKLLLPSMENILFRLDDGSFVPEHFHITEVGVITKHFIDCGGTIRKEQAVNFQLLAGNDVAHRLQPAKLLNIIGLSEEKLGIGDFDIEVEYQQDTIGKYALSYTNGYFVLRNKSTACLAQDACGIPAQKQKVQLSDLQNTACCTPGSGCC